MRKKSKIIAGGILITSVIGTTSFAIIDPYNILWNKKSTIPEQSKNIKNSSSKDKEDINNKKDENNLSLNGIKDGTYLGESKGYGGNIKVKVTIESGKIKNIEVISHSETPKYYENGSRVIESIIKANSTDVDAVSGATLTSNGIKNAVRDALSKAGLNVSKDNKEVRGSNNSDKSRQVASNNMATNVKNIDLKEYKIKDGEYIGEAIGFKGNVRVKVIIRGGKLSDVKVISHNDDAEFFNKAKNVIIKILRNQGTAGVDTVSGATYSSRGIINAVNSALNKVAKESNGISNTIKISENNNIPRRKNTSQINIKDMIKDALNQNNIYIAENKDSNISLRKHKFKDGEYIGEAKGFKGNVKVKIIIKNGTLANIEVINHNDDDEFFNNAKRLIFKILKNQGTTGVDTISGATYSSKGILNAVTKALNNANKKENILSDEKTSSTGISLFEKDTDKLNNKLEENREEPKDNKDKKSTEPTKQDYSKYILPDGDYKGKATGYGGTITVTVKVENGVISKVTVDSHSETPIYYEKVSGIFGEIVKNNSTNIDTVSGATITSKGVLSAVEDALSKVKGYERKEYSDGTWYGQGRGHYSYDTINYGKKRTATEAKVIIKNGKILEAKLVNHGDDKEFERPNGYKLIEKYVIENSNTKGVKEILAKKDRSEPIYDAVSGATNSARGFVNAIDDALNRSVKFKNDGILQEIRAITLKKCPFATIEYGEEVNLKDFVVKVTYRDGHEEDVPFENLKNKGIECSLPKVFTPEPIDKNHYDDYRDYILTFTDKKSTSKHSSILQAKRKNVYKEISEIVLETEAGESYKIPASEDNFKYTVDSKKDEFKKITKVKVFDSNHELVTVDKFRLEESYNLPTLCVELKKLGAKPTDKIKEVYRYNTYMIEFKANAEFNKDKIISFKIDSKPSKLEYFIGEKLNLNGLTITATDLNYKKKIIKFSEFKDNGFIIEPNADKDLNTLGTVPISIKYKNSENQKQIFNVEVKVKEKIESPSKIILQNSKDEIVATIDLKDGQTVYHGVKIQNKYKTDPLQVKVYSGEKKEIKPHKVEFKPGSTVLKVYFTEYNYAFLGIAYE